MTAAQSLDETLTCLELLLGRLADGRGPLDELVRDHEEATRLLEHAQSRLDAFKAHLELEPAG